MAQHRPGRAREHRRPSPPHFPYLRVSDGIDATMDPMQAPRADPSVDAARAEPEPDQLRAAHDTALPRRDLGDRVVCDALAPHSEAKASHRPDSPP